MKDIKNLFLGLFSNQAIIDGNKKKWYWWILIIVLAVCLPWIPVLVSGYSSDYGSILSSTSNQEVDKGIKTLMTEHHFSEILFRTGTDSKGNTAYSLEYDFTEEDISDTATYEDEYNGNNAKELFHGTYKGTDGSYITKPVEESHDYYFDCISVKTDNQIDHTTTTSTTTYEDIGRNVYLEVYYFADLLIDDKNTTQYLNNFLSAVFFNLDSTGTIQNYPHSFLIMGKDFISLQVYPLKATKSSTSASLTYSGTITNAVKDVADKTSLKSYLNVGTDAESINEAYSVNLKNLFKAAAKTYGVQQSWLNVLVVSIVVVSAMIVSTLVLLFMHKRKTSIYRDVKFYQVLEEGIHLTLAPAAIGMVIGFFASNYLIVAILACVLLRLMWIPNKISPVPETEAGSGNKPLYQARS